jgi:LPXTG-motif cell wall-anchored protein
MGSLKIAAIVLIVAGILVLGYGGFSYTRETHSTKMGPFQMSVEDREKVNVPVWAGVGAIALGGVLLFVRRKG